MKIRLFDWEVIIQRVEEVLDTTIILPEATTTLSRAAIVKSFKDGVEYIPPKIGTVSDEGYIFTGLCEDAEQWLRMGRVWIDLKQLPAAQKHGWTIVSYPYDNMIEVERSW